MALILKDRVQETATANTTVSFSLAGASTGYQTFSAAVGNTNTTYYGATDGTNWEVGIGTYATTGNLLNRTTILSSSNAGAAVTFSGTVTVFVDYPSSKSVYQDASSNVTVPYYIANGAITGSLNAGAYSYGTLPYTDVNIFASYTVNQNNYAQIILHNSNAGTTASTDFIVGNDSTTATTFYGDFGMNSSAFSGTGTLNTANTVFLTSTSADLAIGTTTANNIRFVINNGATDIGTITSTGLNAFPIGQTTRANGAFTSVTIQPTTGGAFFTVNATPTAQFQGAGFYLSSTNASTNYGSVNFYYQNSSVGAADQTNYQFVMNQGSTSGAYVSSLYVCDLKANTHTWYLPNATLSGTQVFSLGANGVATASYGLSVGAGSATIQPIKLTSGTNLTTPVAGSIEYDGNNLYFTPDSSQLRTVTGQYQQFYLSAAGSVLTGATQNYFGSTSAASLTASSTYDIECYCYFLKTTSGTVQWIPTVSSAFTVGHCALEYTPVTGFTTTVITGAMVLQEATIQTSTTLTNTATSALTTAVYHIHKMKIKITTNAACNFRLNATISAGSITPQAGSWYTVRKVVTSSGNFVA
jgi:hypothetical protein